MGRGDGDCLRFEVTCHLFSQSERVTRKGLGCEILELSKPGITAAIHIDTPILKTKLNLLKPANGRDRSGADQAVGVE